MRRSWQPSSGSARPVACFATSTDGVEGDPVFADLADMVHACRESEGGWPVTEVGAHAEG